jgi:methionyl-tRNA formyltransferase
VLAIVQETGSDFSWKKLLKQLRPDNAFRKAWRWLRDRRRYTGNGEARFFFGDAAAALDRPELVREVPHINHPDVVALARELQPDLIAVFGTSLIRGELLTLGSDRHRQPARRPVPRVPRRRLHLLGAVQRRAGKGRLHAALDRRRHRHRRPDRPRQPGGAARRRRAQALLARVQTSADVYAELLRRLAAGERFGQTQPHKGRLYQVKQRGLRHERAVERRLRSGLLHGASLGVRITWFPAVATSSGRHAA